MLRVKLQENDRPVVLALAPEESMPRGPRSRCEVGTGYYDQLNRLFGHHREVELHEKLGS